MLSWGAVEAAAIATETTAAELAARIDQLRANEPDQNSTPEAIEAYLFEVRERLAVASAADAALAEAERRFWQEAGRRQVNLARSRVDRERRGALDVLGRLFRLGRPPRPDGRYDGELVAMSTGLLSDPFFEWLTRLYLPWLGKSFDAATRTGDNIFVDNAWSKATRKLGWPEYRVANEDLPGTVRVFPFRTFIGPGIEDPDLEVLKIHYADSPNPLPVRRIVDEVVELPGGYILGKAHMRGLREFRRVAFFGLFKDESTAG